MYNFYRHLAGTIRSIYRKLLRCHQCYSLSIPDNDYNDPTCPVPYTPPPPPLAESARVSHLPAFLLLMDGEEGLLDISHGDQDEVCQVRDERHPQGTLLQGVVFSGGCGGAGGGGIGGGAWTGRRGGNDLWRGVGGQSRGHMSGVGGVRVHSRGQTARDTVVLQTTERVITRLVPRFQKGSRFWVR